MTDEQVSWKTLRGWLKENPGRENELIGESVMDSGKRIGIILGFESDCKIVKVNYMNCTEFREVDQYVLM